MRENVNSRVILRGRVLGNLWWGGLAWKDVRMQIDTTLGDVYPSGGAVPSLRDAMLEATRADFQSCGFVPGETFLEVQHIITRDGETSTVRVRHWDIRFSCWDTDDFKASDADLTEYFERSGGEDEDAA